MKIKIGGQIILQNPKRSATDVEETLQPFLWSRVKRCAFYLGTGAKRSVGSKAELCPVIYRVSILRTRLLPVENHRKDEISINVNPKVSHLPFLVLCLFQTTLILLLLPLFILRLHEGKQETSKVRFYSFLLKHFEVSQGIYDSFFSGFLR